MQSASRDDIYPSSARARWAGGLLVELVRSSFPMRFYNGETWWNVSCAAAALQMADTTERIVDGAGTSAVGDQMTLVRSLYELAVTLSWVAVAPQEHFERWTGDAARQNLKLHRELAVFGETLLNSEQIEHARSAKALPNLAERAQEADDRWAATTKGLHAAGTALSFRGLYTILYRQASRPTHGSLLYLDRFIDVGSYPISVQRTEEREPLWDSIACPLLTMGLVAISQGHHWIDTDRVRSLCDLATAQGDPPD